MKQLDALRQVAYENITKDINTYDDFTEAVCDWWRRKYKIPDTDPRFLNKFIEDIVIEYFEDQFRDDPEMLMAYGSGYENADAMEKDRVKEIMGDDFSDEVVYLEEPPKNLEKTNEPDLPVLGDEETVLDFD